MREYRQNIILSRGQYRLLETISETRLSAVHKAVDSLDQLVIVKGPSLNAIKDKGDYVKQVYTEADRLEQLKNCSNVVKLLDRGVCDGAIYYAMEYQPETLASYLDSLGELTAALFVGAFYQTASALDQIHRHKIVHGDIKLENFMVGEDDRIRLIDFGASRALNGNQRLDHELRFNPANVAPEKLTGVARNYDTGYVKIGLETDIYELGCMWISELLGQTFLAKQEKLWNEYNQWGCDLLFDAVATAKRPLLTEDEHARLKQVLTKLMGDNLTALQLTKLLVRMVETRPAKRPKAVDVLKALQEIAERQGIEVASNSTIQNVEVSHTIEKLPNPPREILASSMFSAYQRIRKQRLWLSAFFLLLAAATLLWAFSPMTKLFDQSWVVVEHADLPASMLCEKLNLLSAANADGARKSCAARLSKQAAQQSALAIAQRNAPVMATKLRQLEREQQQLEAQVHQFFDLEKQRLLLEKKAVSITIGKGRES